MFCSNATDSRCSCVTYSACLVALYCFVRKEKVPKPKRQLTGPIRHFYGLPARLLVSGTCSCQKVYLFCWSSFFFSYVTIRNLVHAETNGNCRSGQHCSTQERLERVLFLKAICSVDVLHFSPLDF